MPMASVRLRPGVNTLKTLSDNEAGVSQSNLVRYQQGMIQKQGGWSLYYPVAIGSTVKEVYAWQGLTGNKNLAVGATQSLSVITNGSNTDITPQSDTTNPVPNFSISSGSNIVTIQDAGSSASIYTSIYLNTPISLGGQLLNGSYQVNSVLASSAYTILAANVSSATVVSSGILPIFTTIALSAVVDVVLPNNGFQAIPGVFQQFIAPTAVGGVTIQGAYQVATIVNSSEFTINTPLQATSNDTKTMNGGLAQIQYTYTLGPPALSGFGVGGFGLGGFGTGTATPPVAGTPITATDWTLANWGELLLACPFDGAIYFWSPNAGFLNTQIIPTAPHFNGGIFVSMPQQILVAWASTQATGVQDPLQVRWSDALDYTNWTPTSQNSAGDFRIPTGSLIVGGLQSAQQGIIWTDIDVWVMQYVGQPLVFSFNRVGSGCGLVGMHAAGVLGGNVYWMGQSNFFILSNSGVQAIPCPIWNAAFQNIDTANLRKVRCAPNSLYNEISWYIPITGGSGENQLMIRLNVAENEWDYSVQGRSAWTDVTIVGNPIGADLEGMIFQHEIGYNDSTVAMDSSFQTGYWAISDGNDLAFVDWVVPDMQFSTYNQLQSLPADLTLTFFAVDYPGDTPRSYGPYPYNQSTQFINTRLRGRLMSVKVESSDLGSFWRLGRLRYRYAADGRR
jgi:hypothetical protein